MEQPTEKSNHATRQFRFSYFPHFFRGRLEFDLLLPSVLAFILS